MANQENIVQRGLAKKREWTTPVLEELDVTVHTQDDIDNPGSDGSGFDS